MKDSGKKKTKEVKDTKKKKTVKKTKVIEGPKIIKEPKIIEEPKVTEEAKITGSLEITGPINDYSDLVDGYKKMVDEFGITEPLIGNEKMVTLEQTKQEDKTDILFEKMDIMISLLTELQKNNERKKTLKDMDFSELNYLKEMLGNNVFKNNFPGGDLNLRVKSNKLLLKIVDEINDRIDSY